MQEHIMCSIDLILISKLWNVIDILKAVYITIYDYHFLIIIIIFFFFNYKNW